MTDLHTMSVEAQQQIQELLVKLPAHFRADVLLQLDRGSIYRRVLQGWDGYFLANPKLRPTVFRLAHHLLATGEVSRTGCVVVPHPGQRSDIAKALGVKERAAYDAATWLAQCPLVRPHPDLPNHLRLFGRIEDLPQGDAQGRLQFDDSGFDEGVSSSVDTARSHASSGANAPGERRDRAGGGAFAPDAGRRDRAGCNDAIRRVRAGFILTPT